MTLIELMDAICENKPIDWDKVQLPPGEERLIPHLKIIHQILVFHNALPYEPIEK